MITISDYEAWKARQRSTDANAAAIVIGAADVKPDEIASDLRLAHDYSKTFGGPVPPTPLVKEHRGVFQAEIERQKNTTLLSKSPRLAEWLRNPENAGLARDDLEGLSWWETAAGAGQNAASRGIRRVPQSYNQFLAAGASERLADRERSFGEIFAQERATPMFDWGLLGNSGLIDTAVGPITDLFAAGSRYATSRLAELFGKDDKAAAVYYQKRVGEIARDISKIPMSPAGERYKAEFAKLKPSGDMGADLGAFFRSAASDPAGFTAFLMETAVESLPSLAVMAGVRLATRSPMLGAGAMGGYSGATEWGIAPAEVFRERGIDIATEAGALKAISDPALMREAIERGNVRGTIIGIMDGLSGGAASKTLARSPLANLALQSIVQAGFGGGGEAAAQIAAGDEFNIAEVMVEALAEFVTAPVEVVAIGGRSVIGQARQAQAAQERVALFEALSGQAQGSALRNRLPDKFREYVERATANGPVESVYVNAGQFVTYFQDRGLDPYGLIENLEGITRDDLDTAIASGGDIQIPTATYAAKMAGSEHDQFFMEHMKLDPDQMSAREAAEFNARAREAMDEAFEIAERARQEDERYKLFEEEIYDTMVTRLREAGRSTDVATSEAHLYPAFYRVMAERSGMGVDEFMQRYPLPQVQGEIPQGMEWKNVDELTRTLAAARSRRTVRDSRQTLLEFIHEHGGIDDVGGELRARDAELIKRGRGKKSLKLARTGIANMVKDMFGASPGGKKHGVDDVAYAAIEAGFMADHPTVIAFNAAQAEGAPVPDLAPVLWEAIDKELGGEAQHSAHDGENPSLAESEALDAVEEYLAGLGVSLDDDDAVIRAAIGDGKRFDQSEVDRGGRRVPITKVEPGTSVELIEVSNLPQRTREAAKEALRSITGAYTTASGETVRISMKVTRKALSGYANDLKLSLVGEFGNILERSVVYGEQGEFSYAVAHARVDGRDVAVRLVIRTDPNAGSRLYQLEGFDVVEGWSLRQGEDRPTISTPEQAPDDSGARSASATPKTVADLVSAFNSLPAGTFPLFQEAGTRRGSIQFPAGGVGNGQTVIRLFQEANLSTMLHESGHYFLTVLEDLAARGETSAASDMSTVREWWRENAGAVAKDASKAAGQGVTITDIDVRAYLDNSTTGDASRDAAVDVGLQEQWARGFEAYLMEGKAPSADLRSVFEKFRSWLISVYRKLTGLNVEITGDLRRVFDRMLATDEEIARAQAEVGGGTDALFASAAQAGMTDGEYAAYLKLKAQAEDAAKARLLSDTMEPIKRETEKAYKEERAKVKEEQERQVNAQPVFRAIEWMGNKRWLGDERPEDMPDMRLSKEILVERYGEGVLKTLPRGKQTVYAVKGGLDPDEAAGWFGFASGDQMVKAMEQAPKRLDAIEAETDRVMNERHNDPLTDGSIEANALDAVHNDKRGQWIAAELAALTEIAGTDTGLTMKQARAAAKDAISRTRVRDAMNANRFLAAERKAAEEAGRVGAMLARDKVWLDAASRRVAAKLNPKGEVKAGAVEALNKAIEQRNAKLESSTTEYEVQPHTITTKDGKTRSVKGGKRTVRTAGYNENVAKLIDAKRRQLINHALYMESRRATEEVEKAERFVQSLGKKAKREKIAGAGRRENARIDYLGAIDEILVRYNFKRMSGAAEQRQSALLEFVDKMKAEGRENELAIPEAVLASAVRRPYKTLTVEELRGVVDSLKNLEHVATRWNELVEAGKKRNFDEVVEGVVEAFEANVKKRPPGRVRTKMEDARHKVRAFLDWTLNATTLLREIDGFADFGAAYRNIKSPIDDAMNRLMVRKEKAAKDLDALYDVYSKAERRAMGVREHMPVLGIALSKWERIGIALNTGNAGNFQRLTDKSVRGSFTEAQVGAVLGTLDERDAKFVQSVWDYLETFRDDIEAREKRATGVAPKWVEPMAVTIGGVNLKGGYYPIKYDPRLSTLSRDDEAQDLAMSLQAGRFGKAQTKNGHLQERAKASGRTIDLDMSVLHRHVNQVVYDLELSEAVTNSWRILQDGRVRGQFMDAGKQADFDALEIWLKDVAEGEIRSTDVFGRTARAAKTNFTAAKLAFNISTVAVQITGLSQTMVVVGKRDFVRGLRGSFTRETLGDIVAKSPFMASRQTTFNKDIYDFYTDPKMGPVASRWGDIKSDYIGPLAFWLMTKVQWHLVDVPTWLAGYRQGLRKFGNDEAQAIAHADAIVKRAQASGLFSDRSAIERGSVSRTARQNDAVRLITTLGSYMFAKFNVAYERSAKMKRTVTEEGVSTKSAQEVLSWTVDMLFLFTLEAVLMGVIRGGLPDGDDEDDTWLKFLAKETGLGLMATMPIVRDVASPLQGFDGGGAYGAITKEIAAPIIQLGQGEFDRALVKSVINATGLATGIPATQINRAVDAGWRDIEGEDVAPIEYLMGRSRK